MARKTWQQLLGTELPIIQAPMAGVQGSALAVAVSNAGGLGSLPCGMLTSDSLRAELSQIRTQTERPFNVNFFCHSQPQPDPEREAGWLRLLAPYYREAGIDPGERPVAPSRTPFGPEAAEVLEQFRPPVVSFHFGLPSPELLVRVKGWGARVLASATTVAEAVWLESHGADGIIAQGLEAGGHRGMFLSDDLTCQMGTFALLPQVVAAVKVPVIAAGGIADAHGVAAAMELGATAVQVGTAYLLCREATTSAIHRQLLQSDAGRHTAITNLFSGRPARGIVNRLMRDMGVLDRRVPEFPLASAGLVPLRAWAESQGKGDFSPLWAGQNVSGCRETGAADLTRDLARFC
ncbi:MAG: nitronate monooxygenase [Porticoccaceae bacterium]